MAHRRRHRLRNPLLFLRRVRKIRPRKIPRKIRPRLAVMKEDPRKIRPRLAVMQSHAKVIHRFW
jgi:hypothetical protein